MNFKEVYKSANENIQGDRNLITAVYEKAEKRHTFLFAPALAAAAVLVFAVTLYPKMSFRNSGNFENRIAKAPVETKIEQDMKAETSLDAAPETKITEKSEVPVKTREIVLPKTENKAVAPCENVPVIKDEPEIVPEESAAFGEESGIALLSETGGGAIKSSAFSGGATAEKSLEQIAVLPEDMSFSQPTARGGKGILYAESPDNPARYIEITPAIIGELGENSEKIGNAFYVCENGKYIAHIGASENEYTVIAENITVSELETLINSID